MSSSNRNLIEHRPRPKRRTLPLASLLSVASLVLLAIACRPSGPAERSVAGPEDGPGTVSVTLAWDAPTTDARGQPLEDLAAYRLYVGTESPLVRGAGSFVEVGMATTFTLEDLAPGTYFFAVSALDESGNESELSNELGAVLGAP